MPARDVDDTGLILAVVDRLRERRTPHEIARLLREVIVRLDSEPLVMVPRAQAFIEAEVLPRLPGSCRQGWALDQFLRNPDGAILPYRNAEHALAAGDFRAVRTLLDALEEGGGA